MNAGTRKSRRLLLLILAVLGALPAYAHADFGPPQALSGPDDGVTRADGVVGSDGVRTVAWYADAGAGSTEFAKLAADGTVAERGTIAAGSGGEPQLVAEPGGDVLAIWRRSEDLAFATIHPDGSVGPIHSAPVEAQDFAAIAGADGAAHVAVVVHARHERSLVVQSFEIAHGSASAPRPVSDLKELAFDVQLGLEPDGTLHIAWTQVNGGAGREVHATTIDRSGHIGPMQTLFKGLVGAESVIGVHDDIVVAERDWPKGDAIEVGRFSGASRQAKFEPTSRIRLRGFESQGATAFAADGSGFIAWQGENGIGGAAVSRRGIAAHPHVISDDAKVRSPLVAIGDSGASIGWRGRGRSFSVSDVKPNGHPAKPEELAPESSQRVLFAGRKTPLTALWISGEGRQLFAAGAGG